VESIVATAWKQDNWFIAQCDEFDIATQAGSEGELIENVREAIALHFDRPESEFDVVIRHVDAAGSEPVINTGPRAELSFLQVRWKLEAEGFRGITQRPNHAKFIKVERGGGGNSSTVTAILPHYTELAAPVLYSILRQAHLPMNAFD
jgi:predicted RNase H-like HicB family nuclease